MGRVSLKTVTSTLPCWNRKSSAQARSVCCPGAGSPCQPHASCLRRKATTTTNHTQRPNASSQQASAECRRARHQHHIPRRQVGTPGKNKTCFLMEAKAIPCPEVFPTPIRFYTDPQGTAQHPRPYVLLILGLDVIPVQRKV